MLSYTNITLGMYSGQLVEQIDNLFFVCIVVYVSFVVYVLFVTGAIFTLFFCTGHGLATLTRGRPGNLVWEGYYS